MFLSKSNFPVLIHRDGLSLILIRVNLRDPRCPCSIPFANGSHVQLTLF